MSVLDKIPLNKRKDKSVNGLGWTWPKKSHNLDFVCLLISKRSCCMCILLPLLFFVLQLLCYRHIAGALSVVNNCPKGWESIQAMPDTRQMWELERLLGQPACLSTLCKIAPCLNFFPLISHRIHLRVLPRWYPLWQSLSDPNWF